MNPTRLCIATFVVCGLAACANTPPNTPAPPVEEIPPDVGSTPNYEERPSPAAALQPRPGAEEETPPAPVTPPPPPPEPTPPPPPPPDTKGLEVDGANITVGSMTTDGFTMTNLACRVDGGGLGALMLGPTVGGVLSKKKAQLAACSPKGGEARVRFTMKGGKITAAEAKADSPAIEACVVKVLKSTPGPMDATCAATLSLSK